MEKTAHSSNLLQPAVQRPDPEQASEAMTCPGEPEARIELTDAPNAVLEVARELAGASPFLDEKLLALRWKHTLRTLQRWRSAGKVPPYIKLGRRISYRLVDVITYEGVLLRECGIAINIQDGKQE